MHSDNAGKRAREERVWNENWKDRGAYRRGYTFLRSHMPRASSRNEHNQLPLRIYDSELPLSVVVSE